MSEANSGAWVVPVRSRRFEGQDEMLVCYVTGAGTAELALQQVKDHVGDLDGETFLNPTPIKSATAKALGVTRGSTFML